MTPLRPGDFASIVGTSSRPAVRERRLRRVYYHTEENVRKEPTKGLRAADCHAAPWFSSLNFSADVTPGLWRHRHGHSRVQFPGGARRRGSDALFTRRRHRCAGAATRSRASGGRSRAPRRPPGRCAAASLRRGRARLLRRRFRGIRVVADADGALPPLRPLTTRSTRSSARPCGPCNRIAIPLTAPSS